MATVAIDIARYKSKFDKYPVELLSFATAQGLKLPGLNSLKGQALALLSQPEVRNAQYVSREHATKFFEAIGMTTRDSIQPFNKGFGLKEIKVKEKYCLVYPFETDLVNIQKRDGAHISADKETSVNAIKEWFKRNIVDVPVADWQVGHLDPTIGDASEGNLAYQPPIQGKYRDRFKFCANFMKMWPTGAELLKNFQSYYTDKEQRDIYEALKKKFEK